MRDYTYAELKRMTKKRVIRIAGYQNIRAMYKDGIGRHIDSTGRIAQDNLSKKYIAKIISSDR